MFMTLAPGLVDVDDERVRVEGVVEIVDENGQSPNFFAHGVAHFVLHIFGDGSEPETKENGTKMSRHITSRCNNAAHA
jgi:hypothetical protein